MKKGIAVLGMALALSIGMSAAAFAGMWRSDENGWWYMNDDGSYPAGTWQWIDGNGDGVAECYYFYSDGYMAYNNDIGGSHVDDDGRWTVGGKVQHKAVPTASAASGRDMSYASYFRGVNTLFHSGYSAGDYYNVEFTFADDRIIDRGDCYEIDNVTIYVPVEFNSRSEAEAKYQELLRSDLKWEFEEGGVTQNSFGTYEIYGMDYAIYSYDAWTGSLYMRKDAVLSYLNYDGHNEVVTKPVAEELASRIQTGRGDAIYCVIHSVDENGYITGLVEAQWG